MNTQATTPANLIVPGQAEVSGAATLLGQL